MNSEINFFDLLIYSNLLIVPLSILLIIIKNKLSNYFFATQFVLYQVAIYFFSVLFFLLSIKSIKTASIGLYITSTLFFSGTCVLYYLLTKTILLKKIKFELKYLVHLIPVVVIIAFLVKNYFNSIDLKSNNFFLDHEELFSRVYFQKKSNELLVLRFLYPSIYLFFSFRLLVLYFVKQRNIDYPPQIKTFIYVLLSSKIAHFACTVFVILTSLIQFQLVDGIIKLLIFLASLITPIYIIINPKIITVITNFISETKKSENGNSENKDIIAILNNIITNKKLFLNANYNIANLSADSNFSIIKIRETIKDSGYNNYSEFINSFKINYANGLINEGYLDKFSIESLSKESGFQSEVTFYRIFKKINGCTPKEYKNKLDTKNSNEEISIVMI
jgi:AraC-like DNA-binding protein